ncbi:MAG: hypothetical protein HZB16_18205 [Armatimonadetes bacterium]|nr:hypothetical protein [Armatimonadota bacterium]
MRFKVIDGGGHGDRPRRHDDVPGLITEEWLEQRDLAMDAFVELGEDVSVERLERLVKRNLVCADTFTTLGVLHGDTKKAHELLTRGLLESVLEVFSTFIDAHRGALSEFDMAMPYLRALAALGTHYAMRGQMDRAIEIWQLLLALDRADGMCVRGLLYGAHLLTDAMEAAEALWLELIADPLEALAWGRPLQLWLSGATARAEAAVAVARHDHPDIEPLLWHGEPRDWDEDLLGTYLEIAPAWQAHPKALAWLKALPVREASDDDYVATGWPPPIVGVDPLMAAHLSPKELDRLKKVVKAILEYGDTHALPELIQEALDIANELANVTDFFYEGTIKATVAGILWVANDRVGAPLGYDSFLAEMKVGKVPLLTKYDMIQRALPPIYPDSDADDEAGKPVQRGLIDLDPLG